MRAKFSSLLAGAFALLVECAVANAVTMMTAPEIESFSLATDPVTFLIVNEDGQVTTNDNNGPLDNSQLLTFDKFNTALGTLNGVTITFTTSYGATATVNAANNGFDVGTVDFFADATIGHSLTGSLIFPQSSPQTFNATCSANDEGGTCTSGPQSDNDNFDGTAGLAAALASFKGSGTFDLTAALTSALAPRINPDNGTDFADNATFDGTLDNIDWNGEVSVVYTYETGATAIPEPLSLYLLLAGLGGIALSQRRRR